MRKANNNQVKTHKRKVYKRKERVERLKIRAKKMKAKLGPTYKELNSYPALQKAVLYPHFAFKQNGTVMPEDMGVDSRGTVRMLLMEN